MIAGDQPAFQPFSTGKYQKDANLKYSRINDQNILRQDILKKVRAGKEKPIIAGTS